jgi:hypothetical protein
MIWVVLGLIGVAFLVYEVYDMEYSIVATILASPLIVVGISLVTLLVAGLFSAAISDCIDHEYELTETTEIYAKANDNIKRQAITNAYNFDISKNLNNWNEDENLLKELLNI